MNIAVIGSTRYALMMNKHALDLTSKGHAVSTPLFDGSSWNELECVSMNRHNIEQADEIHVFWDTQSMGTVFDLGMAFAWKKRVKMMYINPRTFVNLFNMMEDASCGTVKDTGHPSERKTT